jgi:hypothetical protein
MSVSRRIFASLTVVGLLAAAPAAAHHSAAAAYDSSKKAEVQGTITKVILKNPHSFVYLDATDEKGQKVEWMVEMNGTSEMYARGWTKDLLSAGMVVKVVGNPSWAPGSHGLTAAKFSKPDGTPIGPKGGEGEEGSPSRR